MLHDTHGYEGMQSAPDIPHLSIRKGGFKLRSGRKLLPLKSTIINETIKNYIYRKTSRRDNMNFKST
jgi:hypothetical protein